MQQHTPHFEGFGYMANHLNKFRESAGIYSILLKTGEIVHFTPHDSTAFKQWLSAHKIQDLKPLQR